MAQKRRWNFKDDDATADINRWLTGILYPGLYHGFDFNPTANMNLNLVHTSTGFKDVDKDATESDFTSLIITRNGTIVKENSAITINGVAAGHATLGRIDIVVLSHIYVAVTGGSTALYSIITGTPSGSPVAPALADPNTQIKIGELFIPATTTVLTAGGVTWTRSVPPTFAGLSGIDVIGSRTYTSQNFVTNGQLITASLDALDIALKTEQTARIANDNSETSARIAADSAEASARAAAITAEAATRLAADNALDARIGNQTYTEQNLLTNSETITASLNKVDKAFGFRDDVANLNSVIQQGVYHIKALNVNAPVGVETNGGVLTVTKDVYLGAVTTIRQHITDLKTSAQWYRDSTSAGVSWSAWVITRLATKTVLIPAWNMDSAQNMAVNHGLTDHTKIRSIKAMIFVDGSSTIYPLEAWFTSYTAGPNGGVGSITSTQIFLNRKDSPGQFDDPAFDSTTAPASRGYVTIEYEPH